MTLYINNFRIHHNLPVICSLSMKCIKNIELKSFSHKPKRIISKFCSQLQSFKIHLRAEKNKSKHAQWNLKCWSLCLWCVLKPLGLCRNSLGIYRQPAPACELTEYWHWPRCQHLHSLPERNQQSRSGCALSICRRTKYLMPLICRQSRGC